MSDDRLVEVEIFPRQDRLPRKVYYITDEGQEVLYQWLATSLELPVHRSPFMLQLHFAGIHSNDEMLKLVASEQQRVQKRLDISKALYSIAKGQHKIFDNPRQSFYSLLVIEHSIARDLAYRDWLQSSLNRIELGEYAPISLT